MALLEAGIIWLKSLERILMEGLNPGTLIQMVWCSLRTELLLFLYQERLRVIGIK